MNKRNSFVEYSNKRKYYSECNSDIVNYFDRHSESIRFTKLNNTKGYMRILKTLLENADRFAEEGDEIEICVK